MVIEVAMIRQILLECGGVVLVLYGLREVFRDIFHPTASGSLSDFVGRIASLLMRDTPMRPAIGPLALVTVIFCWVLLLATGFALIYSGLLPQEVASSHGTTNGGFAQNLLRSFYFSLGAFDTFQTFDLSPKTNWLRLVISIEGLIGISMITASVSWLVLLYPALARTREFARRVSSWLETEKRAGLSLVQELGVPLLMELAQGVLQFRLDVILFPILLNFYPSDESATPAHVLPSVHRFASEAVSISASSATNIAGIQLQVALEALAHVLSQRVLRVEGDDVHQVLILFQQKER
jgi:hypothetical protein